MKPYLVYLHLTDFDYPMIDEVKADTPEQAIPKGIKRCLECACLEYGQFPSKRKMESLRLNIVRGEVYCGKKLKHLLDFKP